MAKAKELRALFTRKDWCAKGHGNATFIVWQRIFTFESKFHRKAWYARHPATRAGQTACASREHVHRENVISPAQRFCVHALPAQCQAFTRAGNYVQNAWKSAPKVLWNRQSQNNVLPFSTHAWTVGSVALGGARKHGETCENPSFKGGRIKPPCCCASGEGAAIPEQSRLGPYGCRWSRDAGQGEHRH